MPSPPVPEESKSKQLPKGPRSLRSIMWTMLKFILIAGPALYLLLVILLMVFENTLVYPAPKITGDRKLPISDEIEQVQFQSADGTKLFGLFLEHKDPRGILLFCHGNGSNILNWAESMPWVRDKYGLSVFTFDYRGYGQSEGSPSEEGVCEDGRAAVQWLKNRCGVDDSEIILFGRSLGGAVAIRLAAEKDCRGLVLANTFARMPDAGAQSYPFFPVRLLMRNRFPSIDRIKKCEQPLLQAHGDKDRLTPFHNGERLFDASPSRDKHFVLMPGLGHNDPLNDEFWTAFGTFIESLDRQPTDAD